ncbi:MAG: hypothetical protein FJX68_00735 [Alphaproteobacteria bacterium]|nr:hypothetical protein [Alphaproteobacteria bacterium]
MREDAPALLLALEQSAYGEAVRQSVWLYPAANVGHVLALAAFAGAVAIMDARLLGAFAATPPAAVLRPTRRVALAAFALLAASGAALFIAEASHVAQNPVLWIKACLIGLGLANAAAVGVFGETAIADCPPHRPLPLALRAAALLSLALWLAVAACGRLIAYF